MTLADPHKKHYFGVRLEFGGSVLPNPASPSSGIDDDPTVITLTDFTSDVTIATETYLATPELALEFGKNTGSLDEGATRIDVLRSAIPDELTLGPHAPVSVKIYEVVDGDSGTTTNVVFVGKIFSTVRNHNGRTDSDRLICYSFKKQLDGGLGVPMDHQCIYALFGAGCVTVQGDTGPPGAPTGPALVGPIIGTEISECTLDVITGTSVTVDNLDDVGTANGDKWQSGYLEYRGLRIKIKDWDKTDTTPDGPGKVSTTFILVKEPPASWAGSIMRAVPGCPKFIEDCRLRWDNEDNFCGPGSAIPPYNPIFEDGAC